MNIFQFRFIIFWLLLWSARLTYADNATDLATLLNAVHTMKASFTQTILDNHGKAVQQSYGVMAMQRPGKFRWDVKKPIPQLIVANGSQLWIYDPDLEQVTVRSLKNISTDTPALLLSEVNVNLDQNFLVKNVTTRDGLRWFDLSPKKADNMFTSIQLGFKNNQIQEMRLTDNLGHTTRIQYQRIQTNLNLPPTLFVFKPARNVDVIDETRQRR